MSIRRGLASLVALGLVGIPSVASADWMLAGYLGAAHTLATTLHVTPAEGASFDLTDVEFRGEASRSPIYYGYRIGWLRSDSPLGIEAEFTHAKTIAIDTHSASLTHFEQSHGLNFVLGNLTYRSASFCGGRCIAVGRGGVGITIPHVEATYLSQSISSYQYGGPAVQAGAGLEVAITRGLTAVADGRLTYTRVTDDLEGATLAASFTSWHFDFGVGWKFR